MHVGLVFFPRDSLVLKGLLTEFIILQNYAICLSSTVSSDMFAELSFC